VTYQDFLGCSRCSDGSGGEHPGAPYHKVSDEEHYCPDCAFLLGLIDEKTVCKLSLGGTWKRAWIQDGMVYFSATKRRSKKKKDQRNSPEYRIWRRNVYQRDGFACMDCGEVGGELNVHHIEAYAKNKKLRLDVNNGVTLCVSCHKKRHWGVSRNG